MSKHKINKKDAVTFQLVHRSQRDPLIADEDAPQRVLLPIKGNKQFSKGAPSDEHEKSTYESDDSSDTNQNDGESKKVKFKLNLPPVVFPSEVEEEVGMLGKAAPVSGLQLHLDPDIVAAMDEDFDYSDPENQLEDNFMELAAGTVNGEIDEEKEQDMFSDSEDLDSFDEDDGRWNDAFDKEETKSRFTNYSVTSSAIRRNDQLRLLDEQFEKMYVGYEENEIGALDLEEIEGDVSSNVLLDSALDEFTKAQNSLESNKKILNDKNLALVDEISEEDDDENKLVAVQSSKRKWDCESILSTYSNTYNHPKKIVEPKSDKIRINKKTGIPSNVFDKNGLTSKTLDKLNQQNNINVTTGSILDHTSQLSMLSQRPKEETPEERKERKEKLKEYRKERRIEKKINSQAFRDESKRQVKIAINNRNNVQGNKIL